MLLKNRDAIREAMAKDFGSHPTATSDLEVLGVAGRAAYVVSQIEKWTAVGSRDIDPQMYGVAKAEVRYQPKENISRGPGHCCEWWTYLSKRFTQMKLNHILYTGSPAVGKIVMGGAAKTSCQSRLNLVGSACDHDKRISQ